MKRLILILIALVLFCTYCIHAQIVKKPLSETQQVIWGQAFENNNLTRLPSKYQTTLPSDVWTKVVFPTGMQVRFRTNATSITINYTSGTLFSYDYQSKIGANGFDLYVHVDNEWHWVYPNSQSMAVGASSFTYGQIAPDDSDYSQHGYEYTLYLPSICQVSDLSITLNTGASFEYIPVTTNEKPIVFYGTSIINGMTVSRPGNNITNIVSRSLYNTNIVNMGFRSVARMESEVVAALNKIDAQIYFIDCLPNMNSSALTAEILIRYVAAVDTLKKYHPNAAIVLVEHPGYSYQEIYSHRKTTVENVNKELSIAYQQLQAKSYSYIYYLTQEELGIDLTTDFSDHIHPNDKGSYQYANAFLTKIRQIRQDFLVSEIPIDNELELKIYPKIISNGYFNIECKIRTDENLQMAIYDLFGRNIMKSADINKHTNTIDVSDLNEGMYIVTVGNSRKENIAAKIIIKK